MPFHVGLLQECIQNAGEMLLKFYLFAVVGVVGALLGAKTIKGSLIMNEHFGRNLLLGVQCLRRLITPVARAEAPPGVGWSRRRRRRRICFCRGDQVFLELVVVVKQT